MQIHELNNFAGSLNDSAYLAVDNGSDTGKISVDDITTPLNERIDNIITSPAPTEQEIIDARRGANGRNYSSLGDSIRSQIEDVTERVETVEDELLGDKTAVELTTVAGKFISQAGQISSGGAYSMFMFPMKANTSYVITAYGNEVLRFGASVSGTTELGTTLNDVETSTNRAYYTYNNISQNYGYVFGVTPGYSPSFEVYERYSETGIHYEVEELEKKSKKIPTLGDYTELIDTGAKAFGSNILTINDTEIHIDSDSQININLGDIDANSNQIYNGDNTLSNTENIIYDGDVIKVSVDVEISGSTFQQFAIGLKKPGTTTTLLSFFNVAASALVDGRYTFERTFVLETGAKFSIPFMYVYDPGISGTNHMRINGKVSVAKYQSVIDHIDVDGISYYLKSADNESPEESYEIMQRGNAKTVGKLHKNGVYIVDSDNKPVELRGVGLHAICQYTNLHMRKTFDSLRFMGGNLVRVSVYLEDFAFSKSDNEIYYGYLSHPEENKAEIEKIIHNCIDLGLYVLLDWHVMDDQSIVVGQKYSGLGVLHQEAAEEFFEYFSSKYADYPNVLYEFANEPYSLTPAEMIQFISSLRSIVKNNVTDPIMVTGMGKPIEEGGIRDFNTYKRCKALYEELVANGITDVFTSPHIYGSNLSEMQQLLAEQIPFIMTEWGNSSYTGDGAGNDGAAIAQINWMHQNAIAHSIWKFTDQTMTSSLLINHGVINSEKYFFGFDWSDLSHNGYLLLGRYFDYIRTEWIERSPLT